MEVHMVQFDTNGVLAHAPAIFAEEPSDTVSGRYKFLPTTEIIDILGEAGWKPWSAEQVNGRTPERLRTAKHLIRFRHENICLNEESVTGDLVPEILLINSHDGLAAYQLRAGIFRLICANGMVVSEEDFGSIRIRHQAFEPKEVLRASEIFCENTTNLNNTIEYWRNTVLDPRLQRLFVREAAKLRFVDPSDAMVSEVGKSNRPADDGNSLWLTFNRCQENLMTGGWLNEETRRRVRPIKSIPKNLDINSKLWDLASKYSKETLISA